MKSVGPPHSTRLYYRPTPLLREVVAACSALARPFRPTPWAVNRHLQLALLAFADGHDLPLLYDRCNVLRLGDGGCVSLEWSGLDTDPATPTVVVLPTVCGEASRCAVWCANSAPTSAGASSSATAAGTA